MTPFLSFIVFLLTLAGFVIGLINAFRKFKNPTLKLRWVLIPLFFALAALIVNLYVDHSEWNVKNIISELSPQGQDSLEIENGTLADTLKQIENKRKIVKKINKDKKVTQPDRDTSIIAGKESEQTNEIISTRNITPEQRSQFVNYLKDKPKGSFRIQYIAGDREAFEYSRFISNMLTEAGYNLTGGISEFAGNDAVVGISLVINRNETEPRYARAIYLAFQSIGVNIAAERNKQLVKPLEVLISVGHRK